MIRLAFNLPYLKNWIGGYNYILNLVKLLTTDADQIVQPVLFVGADLSNIDILPFLEVKGLIVVKNEWFDLANKNKRLLSALLRGKDQRAAEIFEQYGIEVVFESAQFYGARFPLPVISWIPDFQHRYLRDKFGFFAYWKREIGFRMQTTYSSAIMVSSEIARRDCEKFYPRSTGKVMSVSFAVLEVPEVPSQDTFKAVKEQYNLPDKFFFLPNQFWVHKNHQCVIDALCIVKENGINICVAACGNENDPRDPDYFPNIQSAISEYGLKTFFRSFGIIPFTHVRCLLLSCTALINPSFFEGWSTTVEEAKCSGTPMILSSIEVHKEQAKAKALFFNPDKAGELAVILMKYAAYSRKDMQELLQSNDDSYAASIQAFRNGFNKLVVLVANKE